MSSLDVAVKIGTSHEIGNNKSNSNDDEHKKKQRRHSDKQQNGKGNKLDDVNSNKTGTDSILSSPQNPNTLKRKHQSPENNEVSWHKRVVVHRIPRQDASRSMWNDRDKQQTDQSKCCILL